MKFQVIIIIILFLALGTLGYLYLKKSTPIVWSNDDMWKDSIAVLNNSIKNRDTIHDSVQVIIDTLIIRKDYVKKIYVPIYAKIDTADMYVLDSIIRSSFRFDSVLQQRRSKNHRP